MIASLQPPRLCDHLHLKFYLASLGPYSNARPDTTMKQEASLGSGRAAKCIMETSQRFGTAATVIIQTIYRHGMETAMKQQRINSLGFRLSLTLFKHECIKGLDRLSRRTLDISGALVGLTMCLPVFGLLALCIKLTDKGLSFISKLALVIVETIPISQVSFDAGQCRSAGQHPSRCIQPQRWRYLQDAQRSPG